MRFIEALKDKRMKKNLLLSTFLAGLALSTTATATSVAPEKKHRAQIRLMDSFLANHHYQSALLDDVKSKEILEKYLEYLDYGKFLFTQSEIDGFKQYETLLDDLSRKGELSVVFNMYEDFVKKRKAQTNWALSRLKTPFSDNAKGTLELDRKKVGWARDYDALKKRWEKRLLNEWITLRLAKQSDEKARETLTKRYTNTLKRLDKSKNDDIFQLYANAVTSVYDPHTTYFSPRTGENFEINMRLSLEGIGAQLGIEDELITIKKLIAGGPAKLSGELAQNDKIIGVAQGKTGAMEDVVGWRLDDAVDLIRGKRGTVVRLRIQKGINDEVVEVVLVRDKIKLEESAAKSEVKRIEQNGRIYRVGVIDIPSFYIDFEAANRGEKNYRSTTRDVKRLIVDLQKEGIDGLMIDLRDNGGGSLAEAVDLTGLFFDKGPVVQVRRADGDLTIHSDEDDKTYYDGALAVLINENSASASEIFAGAIKDHQRGVVLGEPSFGKGTVQTVIGLERFLPSIKEKVGQLKMTIAMFYRINGSSTQLKGVTPDIYIPNKASLSGKGGEREEDHALPWRSIDAVKYENFNQVLPVLSQLQRDYDQQNAKNPLMKNLLAVQAWQQKQLDDTVVSLNLIQRKARKKAIRDEGLSFENTYRKLYGYPLLNAEYLDKKDKDKTESERNDEEKYQVDAILDIATKTVADYIRLTAQDEPKTELAKKSLKPVVN